jgi:drug/metabolite transporter (DMT)-like permease
MVLASAASFGTLPVLVKFAYSTGLTPLQTLSYRFLLIEPVVTLSLAVTLLGDRLNPAQLVGAAAVLLAVVIVHLSPEARDASD